MDENAAPPKLAAAGRQRTIASAHTHRRKNIASCQVRRPFQKFTCNPPRSHQRRQHCPSHNAPGHGCRSIAPSRHRQPVVHQPTQKYDAHYRDQCGGFIQRESDNRARAREEPCARRGMALQLRKVIPWLVRMGRAETNATVSAGRVAGGFQAMKPWQYWVGCFDTNGRAVARFCQSRENGSTVNGSVAGAIVGDCPQGPDETQPRCSCRGLVERGARVARASPPSALGRKLPLEFADDASQCLASKPHAVETRKRFAAKVR